MASEPPPKKAKTATTILDAVKNHPSWERVTNARTISSHDQMFRAPGVGEERDCCLVTLSSSKIKGQMHGADDITEKEFGERLFNVLVADLRFSKGLLQLNVS